MPLLPIIVFLYTCLAAVSTCWIILSTQYYNPRTIKMLSVIIPAVLTEQASNTLSLINCRQKITIYSNIYYYAQNLFS